MNKLKTYIVLVMCIFHCAFVIAQRCNWSNTEQEIFLDQNLKLYRHSDGGYSYLFIKSGVSIAELSFSRDSTLICVCSDLYPLQTTIQVDSILDYKRIKLGASILNQFSIFYKQEFDSISGLKSEFELKKDNTFLNKEENDSTYSFSFWEDINIPELTSFEKSKGGILLSKTIFRRLQDAGLSSSTKEEMMSRGIQFIPIKKYFYGNGKLIRIAFYKNGEVYKEKVYKRNKSI